MTAISQSPTIKAGHICGKLRTKHTLADLIMSNTVHYDEENMSSDSSDNMDEDLESVQVLTSRPLAADYSSNDTHSDGNRSSDRPRYHASTIFVSHSNGDGSGRRRIHRQALSDSNEEDTETGAAQGYFIELDDDEISDALLPDSDSELDGDEARELMEELAELHALHDDEDIDVNDDDDDDDDDADGDEVEDDDDEDYLPENEYHIDDDFDIIDDDDDNDEDYYENDDDEEDSSEVAYHAILRMVIQRQQQFIHRTHNPSQRQAALQKLKEHDAKQRQNGGELLAKSGWFGEPDGVYGQQDVFGYRKNGRRREISNIASNLRERELSGNYRGSRNKLGRSFVPKQHATKMKQYDAEVYSGQFSEDGSLFYTCTKDFMVHLYDSSDPESFQEMKSIHAVAGQWTLTDANLSRDKSWLAYSSLTPYVTLASTDVYNDNTIPLNFNESRLGIRCVWSVRFSRSGKEIVAGSSADSEEDKSILLYDIERQKVIDSAGGHYGDVNAVCFADDGSNLLISGSDDMSIRVWDRRTLHGEMAAGVLVGHTEGITYVSPKGDGRYLVSNGKDQCAKVWDIRTMVSSRAAEDTRLDSEFDYRRGNYPGVPRLHSKDSSVMTYRGHKVLRTLIRCHFSPPSNTGQRYIYSGSADGRAHIYNLDGSVNQILDASEIIGQSRYRQRRSYSYTFGYDATPCTRDVSWHPYLPNIISSSWRDDYGYLLKHDLLE